MPDFFNYCPKCKSKDISKDDRKFFHCPQCDFVYYHNPGAATAIILEYDGKILFAVRKIDPSKGMLDLPGGFVDYDETVEDAIKREIKEELNIDLDRINYHKSFPNTYLYKNITYHTIDMIYTGAIDRIDNITVADDVASIELVPFNEIDFNKIAFVSIKNAIKSFLKSKSI